MCYIIIQTAKKSFNHLLLKHLLILSFRIFSILHRVCVHSFVLGSLQWCSLLIQTVQKCQFLWGLLRNGRAADFVSFYVHVWHEELFHISSMLPMTQEDWMLVGRNVSQNERVNVFLVVLLLKCFVLVCFKAHPYKKCKSHRMAKYLREPKLIVMKNKEVQRPTVFFVWSNGFRFVSF